MKKDVKIKDDSPTKGRDRGFSFQWIKHLNRKSKILICIGSVILILAISVSLFFLLRVDEDVLDNSVFYYPASESENIFQNDAYMSFERSLRYSYGGVEQLYQYENDYDSADTYCKFFLDYFSALINGDGEKLSAFYVDGFFNTTPQFTMQMIYEPYVVFHSESSVEENGDEIKVANFEVRYKIFKNNGSFRKGVPSNQAVPQIYQLTVQNGNIKIKNVLEIEYENAN